MTTRIKSLALFALLLLAGQTASAADPLTGTWTADVRSKGGIGALVNPNYHRERLY